MLLVQNILVAFIVILCLWLSSAEKTSGEKSRRERRKEARLAKNKKKFDSWVQHKVIYHKNIYIKEGERERVFVCLNYISFVFCLLCAFSVSAAYSCCFCVCSNPPNQGKLRWIWSPHVGGNWKMITSIRRIKTIY